MGTIRLATRGSPLALRQTEIVSELLRRADPGVQVEPVVVRTRGDQDASSPLDQIGGQGVFVAEVEAAVSGGRADAAVHSAKDMTSNMGDHLVLGAVPARADPRDGLVGCTLADLPAGGLVATGSARRRAQLAYLRPDHVSRRRSSQATARRCARRPQAPSPAARSRPPCRRSRGPAPAAAWGARARRRGCGDRYGRRRTRARG